MVPEVKGDGFAVEAAGIKHRARAQAAQRVELARLRGEDHLADRCVALVVRDQRVNAVASVVDGDVGRDFRHRIIGIGVAEHDLEEAVEDGQRADAEGVGRLDHDLPAAALDRRGGGGRVHHADEVVHLGELQVKARERVVVMDDAGQGLEAKPDEHVAGEGVAVDRSDHAASVGAVVQRQAGAAHRKVGVDPVQAPVLANEDGVGAVAGDRGRLGPAKVPSITTWGALTCAKRGRLASSSSAGTVKPGRGVGGKILWPPAPGMAKPMTLGPGPAALLSRIAWRSEPGPESLALLTVKAAGARRPSNSSSRKAGRSGAGRAGGRRR